VLETPRVSMAIGSKIYRTSRSAYFCSFREVAISAAAPGSQTAALMYDSANVTVTSQHSAFPLDQRTRVRPSGRLPSDLNRLENVSGLPVPDKEQSMEM